MPPTTQLVEGMGSRLPAAFSARFVDDAAKISEEIRSVVKVLETQQVVGLAAELRSARRVFAAGSGRSGLAVSMAAMRWMHLGLHVHRAGEVTAPAIGADDLLVVVSGSGRTPSALSAAHTARQVGGRVALVTAVRGSDLAEMADVELVLPAATKEDRTATASAQYAGALFEQSVVVVLDAVFHTLWQLSGHTAEELWPRHANLE